MLSGLILDCENKGVTEKTVVAKKMVVTIRLILLYSAVIYC
jgi:hypothetical protein